MNIKIIKRPIPAEICEDGGASVVIVDKETVDLETSIDEAKDVLIVVGDKLLVKGMFVGLFKSMVNGIGRDGNARQLGDFITLYPVPTGEFDLDKGWRPGVNGVRIRARLMNELELDISNWEFEDVTPGREAFTLASVECGCRQLGVVDFVHPVWINGKPLPGTDDIRIDWAVEGTDRHGTIAAAKLTSTASRATIAADALAELASEEYDGKTVVFTVRGNFASAKIPATLKYAAPVAPTIGSVEVTCLGEPEAGYQLSVRGENLRGVEEGPDESEDIPIHDLDARIVAPDGEELDVTPDSDAAGVKPERTLLYACMHGEDRLVDGTGYTLKIVLADTAGNPVTLEKAFTYSEE